MFSDKIEHNFIKIVLRKICAEIILLRALEGVFPKAGFRNKIAPKAPPRGFNHHSLIILVKQ